MQKPLFPLSQIQDLKCRHCQKFISCGPVYVVPDSSVLCGRCRMLAKDIYRNVSYEALASIFRYPCVNWENHCPISLQWNESINHEDKCTYQGCWRFFCSHPGACFKGKRDIQDGFPDVRLVPAPDYLLQHIKCIQCEGYLSAEPVYIQTNGKNICHRCVIANGPPPNCLRNLAYERISRIIVFPCIFRNRGCPTRLQFGRELWQHESICSYGQVYKKLPQKTSSNNPVEVVTKKEKERGVIKTHSGHTWGTITPNSQLFAPPSNNDDNINKEVIKSLVKKQERIIKRADEIGSDFIRMNSSEEGSRSSVSPIERRATPNWDDPPAVRASRIEPQVHYPQEDYSNNSSRAQSRTSGSTRMSQNNNPDVELPSLLSESESDVLIGNLPIFTIQKTNSITSYDSGIDNSKRLSRHGSINGPRDLINELKVRQGIIKRTHSVKGRQDPGQRNEPLSPYEQCQNLEDILQKQERIIKRADEIGSDFIRMNSSEEGSRSSVSPIEHRATPNWDDLPAVRASRIEPQVHYPQEDYSNNSSRAQSRTSGSTRMSQNNNPDVVLPSMLSESESDVLIGNLPIFTIQKTNSITSYDSGIDNSKRLSRHGSINGPRDLINELKVRQGIIKRTHSVKGRQDPGQRNEPLSPYEQCQNLEDILQVHDRLK